MLRVIALLFKLFKISFFNSINESILLQSCSSRIAVSPRREDEVVQCTVEMSDVMAECGHCGKEFDLALLADYHENKW